MRRHALIFATSALAAAGSAAHLPAQAAAPDASFGQIATFTSSDGIKLSFIQAGSGQPILFVPGWTMPGDIWEHQLRELSRTNRTIALDPRSQGRSDIAAEGHWHPRRATDIRELILHLDLTDVVLVGWSMAVPEVLTYVELFGTDRLAGLVLVDGVLWIPGGAAQGASFVAWTKQMEVDRRAFAERFVRGMFTQQHSEEYLRRVLEAHMRTPTAVAATLNTNASFGRESDRRNALSKVDRPLLYVVTPRLRQQADTLQGRLPQARVEIFENAGHALFVDAPQRFNQLLREFIRSL